MTSENFTANVMKFNYNSELENNAKQQTLNRVANDVERASQTLNGDNVVYYTSRGDIILNSEPHRIWFCKYVAFVFAIGRIFDEEDDIKMSAVMSYFADNKESAFLNNHFRVESYKDSNIVKELEQKLRIGNGNYHVIMVPVVTAETEMLLSLAPEEQFKTEGIVEKYTSWDAIVEYMKDMISRYGLITNMNFADQPNKQRDVPMNTTTSTYDAHTAFDFNGEVDINLTACIEDKNTRTRVGKSTRSGDYTGHTHNTKRKSLYAQMHEANMYDTACGGDSVMSNMKGVTYRTDDRTSNQMPDYVEFQIYDDEDTYHNNKNNFIDAAEARTTMPRMQQFATRATSNGSRNVNVNVGELGRKHIQRYGVNA